MWPWNRTPAAADHPVADHPVTDHAAERPVAERPQPPGWTGLPPVQLTVDVTARPVAPREEFADSLASWRNPSFLAPLGHLVSPDAPAGVIHRLIEPAAPPTPRPAGPALDFATPRRRPARGGVVQRMLAALAPSTGQESEPATVTTADELPSDAAGDGSGIEATAAPAVAAQASSMIPPAPAGPVPVSAAPVQRSAPRSAPEVAPAGATSTPRTSHPPSLTQAPAPALPVLELPVVSVQPTPAVSAPPDVLTPGEPADQLAPELQAPTLGMDVEPSPPWSADVDDGVSAPSEAGASAVPTSESAGRRADGPVIETGGSAPVAPAVQRAAEQASALPISRPDTAASGVPDRPLITGAPRRLGLGPPLAPDAVTAQRSAAPPAAPAAPLVTPPVAALPGMVGSPLVPNHADADPGGIGAQGGPASSGETVVPVLGATQPPAVQRAHPDQPAEHPAVAVQREPSASAAPDSPPAQAPLVSATPLVSTTPLEPTTPPPPTPTPPTPTPPLDPITPQAPLVPASPQVPPVPVTSQVPSVPTTPSAGPNPPAATDVGGSGPQPVAQRQSTSAVDTALPVLRAIYPHGSPPAHESAAVDSTSADAEVTSTVPDPAAAPRLPETPVVARLIGDRAPELLTVQPPGDGRPVDSATFTAARQASTSPSRIGGPDRTVQRADMTATPGSATPPTTPWPTSPTTPSPTTPSPTTPSPWPTPWPATQDAGGDAGQVGSGPAVQLMPVDAMDLTSPAEPLAVPSSSPLRLAADPTPGPVATVQRQAMHAALPVAPSRVEPRTPEPAMPTVQRVDTPVEAPAAVRVPEAAPPAPDPTAADATAPATPAQEPPGAGADDQAGPSTAGPAPSAAPAGAPPPGAPAGADSPDELVKKLYEPLLRRLKTELRLDRERRGMLTDLRH